MAKVCPKCRDEFASISRSTLREVVEDGHFDDDGTFVIVDSEVMGIVGSVEPYKCECGHEFSEKEVVTVASERSTDG